MSMIEKLNQLRIHRKAPMLGLKDEVLAEFAHDIDLQAAVVNALSVMEQAQEMYGKYLDKSEEQAAKDIQHRIFNFYAPDAGNPYVPLAAKGPWIITMTGCVIHDSGGYGMLGLGHNPDLLSTAHTTPHVMANVMTASFPQRRLTDCLDREIGIRRSEKTSPVYAGYLFLNSGSESVTMAARLADVNTKLQTGASGKYHGKKLAYLSIEGSFHGRTDKPAQVSDSCLETYKKHLASFEARTNLYTVPSNDCAALESAFAQADRDHAFIEAVFLEPVMGEGNPGISVTPEFYATARELTLQNDSLLIMDSIQAGLRTRGVLSVVDYPGFETLPAPDLETYSKALNAGQFPLSVLALNERAAKLHRIGLYGNTMTGNPRAMDVASVVLSNLTEGLRKNIVRQGENFLKSFRQLMTKYPNIIEYVQGTGLLFAVGINKQVIDVLGQDGLEKRLRLNGIGVIHGGENALRFTPHFKITDAEIAMIVARVEAEIRDL